MNVIDIVLLAALGYGAWRGYQQGLVVVLVNTMALVVAIVVGIKFLHEASELLSTQIQANSYVLPILAFALLFSGTFILLRWFGTYTRKTIRYTLLGSLDQGFGAMFGLFRIAFVLSSVLFGLQLLGIEFKDLGTKPLYVFPALVKLGPFTFKLLAPLLPFLRKVI